MVIVSTNELLLAVWLAQWIEYWFSTLRPMFEPQWPHVEWLLSPSLTDGFLGVFVQS